MSEQETIEEPPAPERASEPPASERRERRRLFVAAGIGALVTIVFFVFSAPTIAREHTPFNHFALLADAWLHGRLDLGGPPPAYTGNNDFAVFDDKTFVSFPPFPALLILPLVKLLGGPERVKDGLFFLGFSGVGPAFLFLALEKLRDAGRSARSEIENVVLALAFAFGTVYFFSAVQGTVWFAAHVVGVALACIYLHASIGAERPLVAGLALGLGFATRTPLGFAFPLFLNEAWRANTRKGSLDARALIETLAKAAAPASLVLAVLLWMNRARFGDAFEFGHRYLAIAWRARIEKWGLFSYHYLGRNLAIALTSFPWTRADGAPFQINAHGLALTVTSPFFAWALWPKQTPRVFWALAATAGAVALPSLAYQNSGWIQFGYRFSNDFAPFLIAMIAVGARPLGVPFRALVAWSVIVNAFGAATFQRAGWERYYVVDGTQRIVHQPD